MLNITMGSRSDREYNVLKKQSLDKHSVTGV